ncbi:hypothetical protein J2S98_000415 [Arthrobacter oryzae]|nr:hypothetical protein [Arthrobacter oryzae]
MFTITHGLAGSSSENCRAKVADGDGVGDGTSGDWPTVAAPGVGPAEAVTAEGEGAAEEAVDDDGATALGASGVQAARTVSPAPAARKREKLRRLGEPHW